MSRLLPVTGETKRRIHLPCPAVEPGCSDRPVTLPSDTGLSVGFSFLARVSVSNDIDQSLIDYPTTSPTIGMRSDDVNRDGMQSRIARYN